MTKSPSWFFLVCALALALPSTAQEPKLQATDLVVRHLESIGTAAARSSAKSRAMRARVHMNILIGSTGEANGEGLLVSVGRRHSIAMKFPDQKYPGEQFVFDGSKSQVALVGPATRSMLGDFMYRHDQILRDGLLGGTLLTSWSLLEVNARQATLRYDGLKKLDGRDLHDLIYAPKKADRDLLIHMYFEPETFRHVKTVYDFSIAPEFAHNQLQHGSTIRYRVEESFSDFRVVDGLTLPSSWTLRYTAVGDKTSSIEWQVNVDAVAHNNVVD